MQRRFHFLYIIWGFFFFALCPQIFSENAFADESIEINLKKELKKGNFLIGLKQYLGGSSDKLIGKKNIIFSTENSFIDLYSANGIKHRSKKINISFKNVPLKTTQNIQRLVFGPFSSYETAQRKARNLRAMGYEPVVTYPKNWEVWIKEEKKLLDKKLNYKFFKKSIKSKIVPFLTNKYTQYKLEGPIYITSDQEVKINNVNFGKKFYLVKDSYGTWTLIQKIKFDEYLEGVLPHEIGSNAPVEALKAQAVIARTWAIYNSGGFNFDQYHLCITTQCQVYKA